MTKLSADDTVELDVEGKRLRLDAEKAKYAEAIAKSTQARAEAQAATSASMLPKVEEVPKGEVTLGDNAGAFGPWRAHRIIDSLASEIASAVKTELGDKEKDDRRVLVVDDRSLVAGDWASHRVRQALARVGSRVGSLEGRLLDAIQQLNADIAIYLETELESAPEAAAGGRRRGTTEHTAPIETPRAVSASVGVPGALSSAVEMLGLLRTDYSLGATPVTPAAHELASLTAAYLAAAGLVVEADDFSTIRNSKSLDALRDLLETRDRVVDSLSSLSGQLAPVEAELVGISARQTVVDQAWAKAVGAVDGNGAAAALRSVSEALTQQARRRERAASPARTLMTHTVQVLSEADAVVDGLLAVPEGGQAPLFTAARRERLSSGDATDRITHVLFVNLDSLAADTVTRRSILGTSGLLRFLAAGNSSWLLLEADTGALVKGAQQSKADAMTFWLESGSAKYESVPGLSSVDSPLDNDPLVAVERYAKILVVALAAVLALVGLVSVLAVVRVALG